MPAQHKPQVAEQFGGLHQAALANQPGGHAPFIRPGEINPALWSKFGHFPAWQDWYRCPHPWPERPATDNARAKRGDGEQVIGDAVGQFSQRVGGAGSYDQQVGAVAEPDMQDMRLSTP